MAKKSNKNEKTNLKTGVSEEPQFSEKVEDRFKLILRIMSWTVGICFILVIILPNFEFFLLDEIVKFVFFLGVFNLLLFAFMEFFGTGIKKLMSNRS